jgi:hypothetical protein
MGNSAIKKELNKEDLEMLHKLSKKPIDEIEFWYEHFIKGTVYLCLNYLISNLKIYFPKKLIFF